MVWLGGSHPKIQSGRAHRERERESCGVIVRLNKKKSEKGERVGVPRDVGYQSGQILVCTCRTRTNSSNERNWSRIMAFQGGRGFYLDYFIGLCMRAWFIHGCARCILSHMAYVLGNQCNE